MKTQIIGYSGSGKSTLAKAIGLSQGVSVLYLDSVYWSQGWQERDKEEQKKIVRDFLDHHSSWVIDGNYSSLFQEERLEQADTIIFMNFNRFACLRRVLKRYFTYKGGTRESLAEGCEEKIDGEFIRWVLHDGRTKKKKAHYQKILKAYPQKCITIKNQRALTAYYQTLGEE